ncbi:hypothetical protein [Polyangium sp. y55x31]|uniref:hypothetical protein n=1 Tax=Polyangium sp. y55x31 TaxID=3042688 RepID=UPI0024826521|nr:hypothetical protein [Polyangium sp. y55x31]MDI1483425.1 hypothetical protein [Polyangium sp. y55x31]
MKRTIWLTFLGCAALFVLNGRVAGADTPSAPPAAPGSVAEASSELHAAWTYCADEDGWCSFTGTRKVAYGARGVFAHISATDGVTCNNATFGDPLVGVRKGCWLWSD